MGCNMTGFVLHNNETGKKLLDLDFPYDNSVDNFVPIGTFLVPEHTVQCTNVNIAFPQTVFSGPPPEDMVIFHTCLCSNGHFKCILIT